MQPRVWTIAAILFMSSVQIASAEKISHTSDSLDTVKRNVAAQKAVIVDCRSLEEWNGGHLDGAILLPLLDLEEGLSPEEIRKKLPEGKIIYTHCARGARALAAQELLKPLGYDVRALKPGYGDLIKAGFRKEME